MAKSQRLVSEGGGGGGRGEVGECTIKVCSYAQYIQVNSDCNGEDGKYVHLYHNVTFCPACNNLVTI